jgi:predicted acyl esterase
MALLAGCFGSAPAPSREEAPVAASWPVCIHPWPCADGSEWPAGLQGPFELLAPEHVRVPSHDGVELDGGLWRPKLPEGVRAPVVLWTTPYLGVCSYQSIVGASPKCNPSPTNENLLDGQDNFGALVAEGYAVALFSVRGTGASGGCFDAWGPSEQLDQAVLVEWLAAQAWSNGRVAMMGLSYMGGTPWEAAIQSPPALKAILVGGIVTDAYLGVSTPQGAIRFRSDVFEAGTAAAQGLEPPVGEAPGMLLDYAPGDLAGPLTANSQAAWMDERPAPYFDERRLSSRFGSVRAAVLVAQGFQDLSFHAFQEDTVWEHLDAPAWFVLGQWDHTLRFELDGFSHGASWLDLQKAWLGFWLKGVGTPPPVGQVDYQTTAGSWHTSKAWPPAEVKPEALYLSDGRLGMAAAGSTSFSVAPQPTASTYCPSTSPLPPSAAFTSQPASGATVVAGNPFLLLEIESDQPGGVFAVDLLRVPTPDDCGSAQSLVGGAVDLRFHAGNLRAQAFPVDSPVEVRVDLPNLAVSLEPGESLAVVLRSVSQANPDRPLDYYQRDAAATITVGAGSHLVLPVIAGTLGGAPPLASYPPRPFA